MALSYNQYSASGSTDTFAVAMPYILNTHISVKVDDVLETGITFPTTSTVKLTSTPTVGQVVEVRRTTPRTTPLVDFTDAATLTESDLDKNKNQLFYMSQEQIDTAEDSLVLAADDKYDANSKKIKNVADPVAAQEAVTVNYLNTTYVSVFDAKIALTNADVALTNADVVLTNADVVLTNADVVSTNADVVLTNADVVLTNADVALTNADELLTRADTVLTAADVVTTTADKATTATNAAATAADKVATNADVVLTHADELLTRADTVLTAADVVSSASSASAAATSATAAASSASSASTSTTASATSATAAATSATAAATSATAAAASASTAEGAKAYTAKAASFEIADTGNPFIGRFGCTAGAAFDITLAGAYTPADGDWFVIWDVDDTFDDYTVRLVLDNTEFFDPAASTFSHVVLDFKTTLGLSGSKYTFAYDGGASKWKMN
jgi:hypothetical protein|tara:strand:+ start:422 stop:1759 length:1338 start_codon:yes stop_codon:yes gene_type:complete